MVHFVSFHLQLLFTAMPVEGSSPLPRLRSPFFQPPFSDCHCLLLDQHGSPTATSSALWRTIATAPRDLASLGVDNRLKEMRFDRRF